MRSLVKEDYLVTETTRTQAYNELERRMKYALETYSNVHRGTGHFSMATTALFEKAREIVLNHFCLPQKQYMIIFCSGYGMALFQTHLKSKSFHSLSSQEIGLPLGLRVLAIKKTDLPTGIPFQTGGSTARMVSKNFVIWSDSPQKFEAGTPAILNAIAFAVGLELREKFGSDCFRSDETGITASEILYPDELSDYSGSQMLSELNKSLLGKDFYVPTSEGMKIFINFDNAASTPTFLPIWNVIKKAWHQTYAIQKDLVHEVKKILTDFLGAGRDNYETIFTSNTTEAINMAARFIKIECTDETEMVILNTLLEHNSNELPWRYISGYSQVRLPVDRQGFVNLFELEFILKQYNQECLYGKKRILIVAISGASNVLGTYNDIQAISAIVHKYGARILVDGAQLVAHRKVKMDDWGIDYFALSGHKIYAPFGSGALIIRKEHINTFRAEVDKIKTLGEENVTGIAALGKSIILLQRIGLNVIEEKERILVRHLLNKLEKITDLEVYGISNAEPEKLHLKGGIISFRLKNVPHDKAARQLAEQGGIGIRFGCFCSHLLIKHILKLPPSLVFVQNILLTIIPRLSNIIPGLIRVSFGIQNEIHEVDRFITVLEKIVSKPLPMSVSKQDMDKLALKEQIEEFSRKRIEKIYC